MGLGVLDDNTIKDLTRVLSVEHVLREKSKRFNNKDKSDCPHKLNSQWIVDITSKYEG